MGTPTKEQGTVKLINPKRIMVVIRPQGLSKSDFQTLISEFAKVKETTPGLKLTYAKRKKFWTLANLEATRKYLRDWCARWNVRCLFDLKDATTPSDAAQTFMENGGSIQVLPTLPPKRFKPTQKKRTKYLPYSNVKR